MPAMRFLPRPRVVAKGHFGIPVARIGGRDHHYPAERTLVALIALHKKTRMSRFFTRNTDKMSKQHCGDRSALHVPVSESPKRGRLWWQ